MSDKKEEKKYFDARSFANIQDLPKQELIERMWNTYGADDRREILDGIERIFSKEAKESFEDLIDELMNDSHDNSE